MWYFYIYALKITQGYKTPGSVRFSHSDFNSKAREVAILVSKIIYFSTTNVISDSNERYFIITGTIWHTPVELDNVYAPNFDDDEFAKLVAVENPFSEHPSFDIWRGSELCY